jgi:hypothetical protein
MGCGDLCGGGKVAQVEFRLGYFLPMARMAILRDQGLNSSGELSCQQLAARICNRWTSRQLPEYSAPQRTESYGALWNHNVHPQVESQGGE